MHKQHTRISALLTALVAAGGFTAARADIPLDNVAGFEIGFGGLIQFDINRFDTDNIPYEDDESLRRVELTLSGERGDFAWEVGYDVEGEKYIDNNLSWSTDIAKFTLGQYKQPNSLEELSSTKNNDFIAKAMATNTFATGRRLGGSAAFGGSNWTTTISVFDGELTAGSAASSGAGARATWAPIQGEDRLLHFGLSAVQENLTGDTARFRARPNADLAGIRPVDTATLVGVDRQRTVGVEGIWASGPLKIQGEYFNANLDRDGLDDYSGNAWYASAVWNLTQEPWGYRSGVIRTAGPNEPTSGMWQLGARYDRIDLNDAPVEGGDMSGLTLGVNYYWRKNFKLAANWVRVDSERAGFEDKPDILEFRAQMFW